MRFCSCSLGSCSLGWLLAGLVSTVASVHAANNPATTSLSGSPLAASPLATTLREELVVTANRDPRPVRETGSALSLLDADSIGNRETPFVSELLRELPGLAVNRGGPVGGLTQIRMRGAEGNHTLVLIDGIEFNFASLQTSGVNRIEVLRGPQSALYGSDAVGGVISLFSALPEAGEQHLQADLSMGSQATTHTALTAAMGGDRFRGRFDAAQYDTAGINAARVGSEKDGARSRTLHGIMEADLTADITGRIVLRQTDSEVEEDTQDFDFPATPTQGLLVDSRNETDFRQRYGRAEIRQGARDDRFSQRLALSYTGSSNHFRDQGQTTATSKGDRRKAEYDTTLRFGTDRLAHTVTAGLQHEALRFSYRAAGFADANQNRSDDQTSAILEYALGVSDRFWVSLSGRRDRNDRYRNATTWRSTASWLFPESGTRLHASLGEGIANPGFFELFGFIPASFVGNSELQPERSRGWDAGIEQSLLDGAVVVDLTVFAADLREEITTEFDFTTFTSSPVNLAGESERRGIELSLQAQLGEDLSLSGSFTFVDTEDLDGRREVRRPRLSSNLNLNLQIADGRGNVNLGALYNGRQQDSEFIFATPEDRVTLDDVVLVNMAASFAATPALTLFARIDNLFDADYEELFSFRSPGRAAHVGVRLSLGPQ